MVDRGAEIHPFRSHHDDGGRYHNRLRENCLALTGTEGKQSCYYRVPIDSVLITHLYSTGPIQVTHCIVSHFRIWTPHLPAEICLLRSLISLQHIKASSDELLSFMTDMIRSRRSELAVGAANQRYDLFNQLIENSGADIAAGEKGEGGLKDDELVG
jgi:hypothetical protein